MNKNNQEKMSFITKRQFIEWSVATLTIEISKGRKPRSQLIMYFCARKLIGSDAIFMEKIRMLIHLVSLDYTFWITHVDKYLPGWMFRDIADIIIERLGTKVEEQCRYDYAFSYLSNVNNILYILSKKVDPRFISWCKIEPLSEIRKLLPWVNPSCYRRMSDDRRDIMGDKTGIIRFYNYAHVKDVIKYSDGYVGIYSPDYDDFYIPTPKEIEFIISAGWKIILNLKKLISVVPLNAKLKVLCDIIIAAGFSDWLFGKENDMGENNLILYETL